MNISLPSTAGVVDAINDRFTRFNFGSGARTDFYRILSLLMSNGVQLKDALNELYNVYSDDGKKPKTTLAVICRNLIDGISSGKRLSEVLRQYVSYTESSLIAGGEKSGDMTGAFDKVIRVISKRGEIMGAVAMATVYPAVLGGMLIFVINMVSTKLVPKFARMSNPDAWEGNAKVLYLMGQYVNGYGPQTLVALFALAIGLFASFPYLRGPVRIYLDRIFPWSLYRMLNGSTFLLNVAVMVGSGTQVRFALEALAENANPWLKERIRGAIYGTGLGDNLGVALRNSGYEFPDRRAVRYLQLLANQDGFEQAVANFAESWMDESVRQAKAIGKVVLGIGIAAVGGMMLLILDGTNGITETIQGAAR